MSETQTASLTGFLLARIAEDEAVARAAQDESPTPWADDGGTLKDAGNRSLAGYAGEFTSPFIARHDPARVLAECEAKRRIVEDFTLADADYRTTRSEADEVRRLAALLAATRVASVYADHPDYRDEWRP